MQPIKLFIPEKVSEFIIINTDFPDKIIVHLYVKQHSITKLKYFGKTVSKDPIKYPGSGTVWKRHYKKHGGKKFIETLKVWSFNYLPDATEFALQFSEDNNIVESDEWANLIIEDAIGGGPLFKGHKHTEETRKKQSVALKGRPSYNKGLKLSPEIRKNMSESHIGKRPTEKTKKKLSESRKGNKNPRYGIKLSEKSKLQQSETMQRKANGGYTHLEMCELILIPALIKNYMTVREIRILLNCKWQLQYIKKIIHEVDPIFDLSKIQVCRSKVPEAEWHSALSFARLQYMTEI